MNRLRSFFITGFSLFLAFGMSLSAHPNTTIDYRIFFKFDGLKVTDIGESWTFDETTSQELMRKYDLDKKITLSKKEAVDIGKKLMESLFEVRYFTYISVDGRDLGKIEASGFKARITKGIVSVAFNSPLPSPVDVTKSDLRVRVEDIDYTVTIKPSQKKPVLLIGAPKERCKVTIKEKRPLGGIFFSPDLYEMDMFVPPKEIGVNCKDKN